MEDKRVVSAGIVGHFFQIDPLVVLNSTHREWAIRMAAYKAAVAAQKEAQDKAAQGDKPDYSEYEG